MTFENNTPLDQVDDRTLQEGKVIDQAIADQMQIKQEIATDQKPVTLQAPISKTTLAESTSNQYQNPDLIKDFIITPKDTQRLLLILNTKNIREFSINLWKWMKERFPAMTKDMVYSRQIYNGRSGSQSEYYTFEVLSRGLAIVVPALKLKLDQMLSKQGYASIDAYIQDVNRLQPGIEDYVKTVNKITAFEVDKKKLLDQYYTGDQSKADNDTLLVQNGVQKLLKLQKEAGESTDINQQSALQIEYIKTLDTIPKQGVEYVQQVIRKQEQSRIGIEYQKLQSYQSRNVEFAKVFGMAEQLRSTGVMNCLSNCKKTNQVLLLNDTVYLPGVKKDLISAQKKQLEADVFWLALKTINMSGYVMLNTLSGAWKGLVDSTISTLYKGVAMIGSVAGGWSRGHTLGVLGRGDDLVDAITPDLSQAMSAGMVDEHDNIIFNWDNMPNQLGSGLAQMFVLIYGGSAITSGLKGGALKLGVVASEKLLGRAGLFTSSMLQQVPRSYETAIKGGLNNTEAFIYAMIMGSGQSGLELISPNKLFGGEFMAILSSIIGVSASEIRKDLVQQLVVKLTQEVRDENIQEQLQGIAEVSINMGAMEVRNSHAKLDTKLTTSDIIATGIMTTMITFVASGGGAVVYNNVSSQADMLAAQQSMAHLLDAKVMKFGDFANLYLSKKTIPVVKLEKLKTHIQSITDTTPSEQSLYDSIVKQIDARFAGNNSIVDENNAILNNIYQSTKVENSRTSDKLALNPTDAQLVTQYETLLGRSLTPSHIQAIIDAHEAGGIMDQLTDAEIAARVSILKGDLVLIRDANGKVILDPDGKVQTKQVDSSPSSVSLGSEIGSNTTIREELFSPAERRKLKEEGYVGKKPSIYLSQKGTVLTTIQAKNSLVELDTKRDVAKKYPIIIRYQKGKRNKTRKQYIEGKIIGPIDLGESGDLIGEALNERTALIGDEKNVPYIQDLIATQGAIIENQGITPSERSKAELVKQELMSLKITSTSVSNDLKSASQKQQAINAGYWAMVFDEFEGYYTDVMNQFIAKPKGDLVDIPNFRIEDGKIVLGDLIDPKNPSLGRKNLLISLPAKRIMAKYYIALDIIDNQISRSESGEITKHHWEILGKEGIILDGGTVINSESVKSIIDDIASYKKLYKESLSKTKYDIKKINTSILPMDVTGLDGDLGIKFVGDDATSPALLTNGRLDMHKVIQAYHNMDFFEIFYNEGGKFDNINEPGQAFNGEDKIFLQDIKKSKTELEKLINEQIVSLPNGVGIGKKLKIGNKISIPIPKISYGNKTIQSDLPFRDWYSAVFRYKGISSLYTNSSNSLAQKYGRQINWERIYTLGLPSGDRVKIEKIHEYFLKPEPKPKESLESVGNKIFGSGNTITGKLFSWISRMTVIGIPLSGIMGSLGDGLQKYVLSSERATIGFLFVTTSIGYQGFWQGDILGVLSSYGLLYLFGSMAPMQSPKLLNVKTLLSQKPLLMLLAYLAYMYSSGDDDEKKGAERYLKYFSENKEKVNEIMEQQGLTPKEKENVKKRREDLMSPKKPNKNSSDTLLRNNDSALKDKQLPDFPPR